MYVIYGMALQYVNTIRLHGSERVKIQWHYSSQENLYCCEESLKQFTKTSDHYTLFLKINFSYVKKCEVVCDVLWMHQTKYFGLSVFFLLFVYLLPSISLNNQEFTVLQNEMRMYSIDLLVTPDWYVLEVTACCTVLIFVMYKGFISCILI
jgi:hypothetical protein